jgi:hypothetical protein
LHAVFPDANGQPITDPRIEDFEARLRKLNFAVDVGKTNSGELIVATLTDLEAEMTTLGLWDETCAKRMTATLYTAVQKGRDKLDTFAAKLAGHINTK